MSEKDSLGGFDLNDFFAAVEKHGSIVQAFKSTDTPIQPPLIPERAASEGKTQRELQEAFETRYLINAFNGYQKRGPREDAQFFHDKFIRDKSQLLSANPPTTQRKMVENMTLQSLADTAEKQFKKAVSQGVQAGPNTAQMEQLRLQVDFWALVSQIVTAAAEIKDQ